MSHNITAIGEILWDVFPDGPRFGGAPANFACSVAEQGRKDTVVAIVGAVGDDDLGKRAIQALAARRVRTETIQVNEFPTGRVDVSLDESGVAAYRFAADRSWDYLAPNHDLVAVADKCDAVCFGTLGQRSDMSRQTIRWFVQATPESAFRVLDVNIRKPFVSDALVLESLELANVLKLNDQELPVLQRVSGFHGSDIEILRQVADRFELRCVALTLGAGGSVIIAGDTVSELPATSVDVVDTVGAGDAFTASMTLSLLAGRDLHELNQRASTIASYVCSQSGATPSLPNHLKHPSNRQRH
ncbi:MAG: carbohydrate kinase [Planctomycetaceae bacterium]|nr:carbohydrate kinase [Planctomycetaceae bacterium]